MSRIVSYTLCVMAASRKKLVATELNHHGIATDDANVGTIKIYTIEINRHIYNYTISIS